MRLRCLVLFAVLIVPPAAVTAQLAPPQRPFGTLRDQADTQQRWLAARMATVLPAVMRKYAVDMWVIPMREYMEDPVFTSIVSPTTFAARRRTIYVFSMRGDSVERIALGGSSQGGVYTAVRSAQVAAGPAGGTAQRNAELWGDEQWAALKKVIEERNPKNIAVNVSRVFAFSDGLSAGEMEGMREALGEKWTRRFVRIFDHLYSRYLIGKMKKLGQSNPNAGYLQDEPKKWVPSHFKPGRKELRRRYFMGE